MLGTGLSLIKSAYSKGLSYVRDGLKLYMPYRGANHDEVKFVGSGSTSFDGGDWITTSADSTAGVHTYCWWQKSADNSRYGAFGHGGDSTGSFFPWFSGNKPLLYLKAGSGYYQYWEARTESYDNVWHHWTLYLNFTDVVNSKLYIDGIEITKSSSATAEGSGNAYTQGVTLGATTNTGDNELTGSMKNFGIWQRELTPTEIQNVMYKTYDELSGRLTTNLVNWWALETEHGDHHGSNNGTNVNSTPAAGIYGGNVPVIPRAIDNAPTVQADGIGIGSASFTASNNDYVDCGDAVSGISDYPFSVTGWFKGETRSSDGHLFCINDESVDNVKYGVMLRQASGEGELRIFAQNTTSRTATTSGANEFNDDDWHHFAAVFTNATDHKLYTDGIYRVQNTTSVTFNSATDSFAIGIDNENSGLNKAFQGEIAQVGLWSKAMTQAQILSVMEKTYDEFNADDKTNLVSYWGLDVNANDSHGSNNGTLS